jgi:UDP-N-acetylmuramoylalanine--D-glutamate ligase
MQTGAEGAVRGYSLTVRPKRGAFLTPDGMLALVDGSTTTPLVPASSLRVPGRHNVANALAAAVAGQAAGVSPLAIAEELRAFEGVPRRLETVAEKDGVLWVNDSAATTPTATMSALDAFDRAAVVILGGVAKGADFTALAKEVVRRGRGAVLIGQAADDIGAALAVAGGGAFPIVRAGTLAFAVDAAARMAQHGDVVLLSPACASFDMFSSADDRGDQFVALVRRRLNGTSA